MKGFEVGDAQCKDRASKVVESYGVGDAQCKDRASKVVESYGVEDDKLRFGSSAALLD